MMWQQHKKCIGDKTRKKKIKSGRGTTSVFKVLFDSLTLKNDWHLISPYNITPETHIKVRRIKEMITIWRKLIVKQILLLSFSGSV